MIFHSRFATLLLATTFFANYYAQKSQGAPTLIPMRKTKDKTVGLIMPKNLIYPRLETAFSIPDLTTDPFDYEKTDVRVRIRAPKGQTLSIPAFFDGGSTWRVRHTPSAPGSYSVTGITLNGQVVRSAVAPSKWDVKAVPNSKLPGFVRIDARDQTRFAFSNGTPYYPLGHNQAWQTGGLPDIPVLFDKMGAAGENWSRVWMNHWDNKNLDWISSGKPGPVGTLSLDVARRWDTIVGAAERNGIAFQLVFQHHGQYSSTVNPNWGDNPYNLKNGGFLTTPNEFFTNAQAKTLTKRKLRYAVARWGYSPAILAWELFNEVQFTDSARAKEWEQIAAWHREMADFLRAQDAYDHLVTTSSTGDLPLSVWANLDYYQEHTYPADVVSALNGARADESAPRKPFFVGEFGPSGVQDPTGAALHAGLWAGMMNAEAGAPQFWTWDDVERHDLYPHFRGATTFLASSGFAARTGLKKTVPDVQTPTFGDLNFGPGGDWGQVKQFIYDVKPGGPPSGIGALSRYLQGDSNRKLEPQPLVFEVDFARAGQFVLQIGEISTGGARVVLQSGELKAERDFPGTGTQFKPQGDAGRIALDLPAGKHRISLQNTGKDWAAINNFTLTNYAPTLGAYGVSNPDFAAAWVYNRAAINSPKGSESAPMSGEIALSGLKPGRYRATWWDTLRGAPLETPQSVTVGAAPLILQTPAIARDAGLFVRSE